MLKFKHHMFNLETSTGRKDYEDKMTEQVNSNGKMNVTRFEMLKKKHKETDSDGATSEWDELFMILEYTEKVPAKEEDGEQELP